MISGFAQTIFASAFFPLLTSITATRLLMPICGAASPTPFAAYMDSNMSSTSACSSTSNLSTGLPGVSSTGSPYFTMGWIIAPFPASRPETTPLEIIELPLISVEIPAGLFQRVPAELFHERARQRERHHGLAGQTAGRNHADVRPLVGRLYFFLGVHVRSQQRPPQRRNRLQVSAHHHVLTIRDAAFEPAGATRQPIESFSRCVVADLVLHFRAITS